MNSNKSGSRSLRALFVSFFKIGLFTFGGGYAMIALLEKEFVENKQWLSHDEFMDIVAIAESTPGPIAINCATYIGFKVKKALGSLFATTAVCLPSFTIIYLISLFFRRFSELEAVAHAFRGIQACVLFLILSAGIKFLVKMKKNVQNILLAMLTFLAMIAFSVCAVVFSSVWYILIGAAVGLIVHLCGQIALCHRRKGGSE